MNYKNVRNAHRQHNQLEIPNRKRYRERLRKEFGQKALRPPKPFPPIELIESMKMKLDVYHDIKNYIGSRPAESGGLLISSSKDYTITCFVFDIAAATNRTIYQPDTEFLNSVLKGRNDEFAGIAHSHAKGATKLSSQDQRAAWSNMTSPGNPHLNAYLMPLIQTIPDTGRFEIVPYIVICHPGGRGRVIVKKVDLKIID